MDTKALKEFEASLQARDGEAFYRQGFEGLMQQGWGWQALQLDPAGRAMLANLLMLWIARAPAEDEQDAMRLMMVRNGLRRLAAALGQSLSGLVGDALGLRTGFGMADLPAAMRKKLAFLADAATCMQVDIVAWSGAEPELAMIFAMTALDDMPADDLQLEALNRLAELIPSLPLAVLPARTLTLLYRACFRLSYITGAKRYDAKAHLVRQASRVLADAGIANASGTGTDIGTAAAPATATATAIIAAISTATATATSAATATAIATATSAATLAATNPAIGTATNTDSNCAVLPGIRPGSRRASLLVIAEGLAPGHAMLRFFAPMLREMRRDFQVTLMTDPAPAVASLPASAPAWPAPGDLADSVIHFGASADPVAHWAEQIRQQQPDIIFYPAIGMSFATFTLSLLRLAPLQVASTGHPASSCSPVIDATLLFSGLAATPGLPLPLRYDDHRLLSALMAANPLPLPSANHPADAPGAPCIGVNAVISKLNASFLDTVAQVLEQFGKPCRLRFLPNAGPLELQALTQLLTRRFPAVEVVASLPHAGYLAELAECDLMLQSFPFGGANTTNDALSLGIPVVALHDDRWLAGQTDAILLAARGMGQLCTGSVQQYVELAVRLLREPAQRQALRRELLAAAPAAGQAHQGKLDASAALLRHWQHLQAGARPLQ
ncbi:MAG: hypothetical protein ACRYGK_12710 [Janthinobacterium lividum]